MNSENRVALARCEEYDYDKVKAAIKSSLDNLGGLGKYIKKGDRVLLKPNFLLGKAKERAVNTHPYIVKAVAELVLSEGAVPIIGDSPGFGTSLKVADRCGLLKETQGMGIEIVEFKNEIKIDTPNSKTFKTFEVVDIIKRVDKIINLPKVKTHQQMEVTLCVKNIFGTVVGHKKAGWHLKAGREQDVFASMLVDLYTAVKPTLNIADGIVGMEGNGPGNGTPVKLNFIACGEDGFAVDTVITELLGYDSSKIPTIKEAQKNNLGITELKNIEIAGEKFELLKAKNFKKATPFDVQQSIPKFLQPFLRDVLTSKPVVNHPTCTKCKVCERSCPPDAIELKNGKIVMDYNKCIRCYCCQELCPHGAINSKTSWLASILRTS